MISTGMRFEYHPIFIGIYFVIVLILAMQAIADIDL